MNAPIPGPVRVRTATVGRRQDMCDTVRGLTLQALEPTDALWRPDLVEVVDVAGEIYVELHGELMAFARAHGCRTVGAHSRRHRGRQLVTVVLVRHQNDADGAPAIDAADVAPVTGDPAAASSTVCTSTAQLFHSVRSAWESAAA